jgi:hypothetical protein
MPASVSIARARRTETTPAMDTTSDGETTEEQELRARLSELESEHRDLDDVIERLADGTVHDQLQIKRLKKRKLQLKDEITKIRSRLLPDIIA